MPYVIGFLLFVLFLVGKYTYSFFESIGWGWLIFGTAIFISFSRYRKTIAKKKEIQRLAILKQEDEKLRDALKRAEEERFRTLLEKYGEDIGRRVFKKEFWIGQTAGQLLDSRGRPDGIDSKTMATRSREIWKYKSYSDRTNSYSLKITLDDEVVTKIDDKR